MKRKLVFILVVGALVAGTLLAGCAGEEGERPIKIGVLAALTGSLATNEEQAVHGIKLALDEVNYEVAGRKIELIVKDVTMDPAVCLQKVKELKLQDNVDLILGPVLTSQGLAIRDYIHENEILTIAWFCSSPKFLEEKYSRYFFRSSHNSGYQPTGHSAYIPYTVNGYRTAVAIALDYQAGRDEVEGFKRIFEGLGGEVTQEIYTPIGTLDYVPFVTQIDLDADFVWSFHWGDDAVRFVNALDDFGIKDQMGLFFTGGGTVETPDLWAQGDSAVGIEDASHYSPVLDTPENLRFVQAIQDKYHEEVSIYTEHGYVAAKMAILALQEVDGDVEDVDGMIQALENLEFEAPRGPIRFEGGHSPIQNVYHRVVEKVDGKLQNTVLDTYTDVGPYWMPEELR